MARVKNSSFQGATTFDTEVHAPSFTRVLKTAQGDAALIYDKVTGRNSEANTINREGDAGRGAKLRIPLVNQCVNANLAWTASLLQTNIAVVMCPIFIPTGQLT